MINVMCSELIKRKFFEGGEQSIPGGKHEGIASCVLWSFCQR